MQTPARILRASALERDRVPRLLNQKQRDRHERIMTLAQGLFVEHGFATINFRSLAIALRIASSTLRFHFADLDALLGALLRRHLRRLSNELAKVPPDAPDRQRHCRAAYLAYTRVGAGGLSEPHRLLVEYGHLLPVDERQTIERLRDSLAETVAGHLGHEALLLLDSPLMNARRIEAALMAMDTADIPAIAPPEAPQPAPQVPPPNPPAQPARSHHTQAAQRPPPDLEPSLSAVVMALAQRRSARSPPPGG